MKIRNRRTGVEYETTKAEYDRLIGSEGISHKYEVLDDGAPFEVKKMREKKLEKIPEKIVKKEEEKGQVTEVKEDKKNQPK